MIKSPFKNIDDAFMPFFDTLISIKGIRADNDCIYTSLQASVFPVEDIEPFCDTDIDTEIKKIQIIVDKIYFGKIQVGDEITTEENEKYKVCKVENVLGVTRLEARSI